MPARNREQIRRELDRLRRGSARNYGDPMGYIEQGGQSLVTRGDRDAPWLKSPPFPSVDTLEYFNAIVLDGLIDGPLVEVATDRIITAWIEYTPAADAVDAQLVLAMDGERPAEAPGEFFPVGVVDQTLAALGAVAQRTFFQSELITPVLAAGVPQRFVLPFDVSFFQQIRLRARELKTDGDDGLLTLGLTFSI